MHLGAWYFWISLTTVAISCRNYRFFYRRHSLQLFYTSGHSIDMNLKYSLVGIVFGLALTKGEAISWFRMQEMFHFQSFHMYGIFMTAVPMGAFSIYIIQKFKIHTRNGEAIDISKHPYHHGIILGGFIFGIGWAL